MSSVKAPVDLPIAAARLGTYTVEAVENTAVKTEMTEIKLEDHTNNNDSKSIVASGVPPGVDLDKFQEEQKKIEEANKRRKELLSKAIADR